MDLDAQIDWLMQGDVSVAWQTARDLLDEDRPNLRARIATEGWGKAYLDARNPDGFWGERFYFPRWTCTHYVLLELQVMGFPPDHPDIARVVAQVLDTHIARDGGLGDSMNCNKSDVCVTGMFLNYAAYFGADAVGLQTLIDFLLSMHMPDGGFNCSLNRSGATHSSMHSTTSVLEGFWAYENGGYSYRLAEVQQAAAAARRFILQHRFFKSDRTGRVISKNFLQLPYPARWRYNILRGLDHFRAAGQPYDPAMDDALDALMARQRPDGLWPRMAVITGKVFFTMEPPRGPSRWNTLLALRVLRAYSRDEITA